jgi:protein SCO1
MMSSPIILSSRYAVSTQMRNTLEQGFHIYGHQQPSPDELGGVLQFSDWRDQPVSFANFLGRWTLLYFGYSRCTGSCTTALPLIAATAEALRARGLVSQAAFVDIDAAPLGITRLDGGIEKPMRHGPNWDKRYAMRSLASRYGDSLMVLTGSRHEIADAGMAFHVIREHIPPRDGENGHSINHSSMIYFIGPDTLVAGYGYHDADMTILADTILALSEAPRRAANTTVLARRASGRGCGPTTVKAAVSLPIL